MRGGRARLIRWATLALLPVLLGGGCGGGGNSSTAVGQPAPPQVAQPTILTSADVGRVIAQAVHEARARNAGATIAVTDRVGNVLGLFRMNNARDNLSVTGGRPRSRTGLEGLNIPGAAAAGAVAKAITGAYLSSGGNAFTTRTASQIVQDHFNPGEGFTPSGPLYGVQFSQLPCSDLSVRGTVDDSRAGPKRSPLGLAADPGGLPLYKNGVHVGAIGVIADNVYTLDLSIIGVDRDLDELIALAGAAGFEPPADLRADRITVDGKTLRFADGSTADLISSPGAAPAFNSLIGPAANQGQLVSLATYFNAAGGLRDGTSYGSADGVSGYRPETSGLFNNPNAMILVGPGNTNRFPPSAANDGPGGMTAEEVRVLLEEALGVATTGRAQIRRPLNSFIQVTISVVDRQGDVVGIVRTVDAPVFGTDVSLQKARGALFFSSPQARTDLQTGLAASRADLVALDAALPTLGIPTVLKDYIAASDFFLGPNSLTGQTAFTMRAIGNLHRPYYPDGLDGNPEGPYSTPFNQWSPFAVGLQLDLVLPQILRHVAFLLGILPTDIPVGCTYLPQAGAMAGDTRLRNGTQIFPGASPVYRNGVLIGAVGVSGDGIDQDDMIAFLGIDRAGRRLNTGLGNAPMAIRADNLTPQGARLRYVSCPFAPFLNVTDQTPCEGK